MAVVASAILFIALPVPSTSFSHILFKYNIAAKREQQIWFLDVI